MASGTKSKYADGTDSGWISLENSTVFTGKVWYRRIGNTVYVNTDSLKLVNSFTSYSVTLLGNNSLPKPKQTVTFIGGANSNDRKGMGQISTNGALSFWRWGDNSTYPANANIFLTVTYIVD